MSIVTRSKEHSRLSGFSIRLNDRSRALASHKNEDFEICFHPTGGIRFDSPSQIRDEAIARMVRGYLIRFSPRFLYPLSPPPISNVDFLNLMEFPELAPFALQRHMDFELAGNECFQAEERCKAMLREFSAAWLGSEEIIRCTLKLLLLEVVRIHEDSFKSHLRKNHLTPSHSGYIPRILEYISEHLSRKISLEDLSRHVSLSPNYLSHLIKRETGKTYTRLVLERRLERAKDLLRFTSMRLAEIAEQTGFTDESYFSRRFKAYEGKSPREFRSSLNTTK